MALAFASLPKVNRSRQRTRLRPRNISPTTAATAVAFNGGGPAHFYAGSRLGVTSFTSTTNRHRLQELLSAGVINIAP